ncbi:SHOCT domain-containing protein [Promicromonospora sukumoe]|uniref:SHOCT domain-containing protein n=1 Tax=Promicromonospora sukumoe TaxID=88382 RepID=UPI0018DB64C9|nr:SHOCT domain-containing protein [Promicromonospora sukumoe]
MGLLRGVARTAVVAGTATAVSNRVSRRQANRWAAQESYAEPQQQAPQQVYVAPPPPQPAASGSEDVIAQLERLGKLRDEGVLTDAEFSAQKARLLAG